ncbi:hypothetical protein [Salipaludibacillus keqinensis]|nr:hypothetical protein [Salipaludibacillus keqinensis]
METKRRETSRAVPWFVPKRVERRQTSRAVPRFVLNQAGAG